jgi:hypothetical protein
LSFSQVFDVVVPQSRQLDVMAHFSNSALSKANVGNFKLLGSGFHWMLILFSFLYDVVDASEVLFHLISSFILTMVLNYLGVVIIKKSS